MSTRSETRLIIGCGYLGMRIAQAWQQQGHRVFALTRSRAETFRALGWEPLVGDITQPGTLPPWPEAATILYAVGMDRSSGRSFREVYVDGLRQVLTTLPREGRLIYVSSTSVYGQCHGELVDENSPTEPIEESGQIILEAEHLLRTLRPSAILLRFAGIYGPDRVLRRSALLAGQPLIGDADKWLNLIHVDDGVQAVLLAETRAAAGELYIVSDNHPVRRRDFYTEAARLLGAPPARFEPLPPGAPPPPMERGNRRLNASKIRLQLGFTPQFPTYVEGLAHAIATSSDRL